MTDAEARDVIDMWLRADTVMGEWHEDGGGEEWHARDCSTKVGPLAGPPVSLRVVRLRARPDGRRWVGEARRAWLPGHFAGQWLQILPAGAARAASGWPTAEAARASLEALLRDEHDPASIELPNIEWWERI